MIMIIVEIILIVSFPSLPSLFLFPSLCKYEIDGIRSVYSRLIYQCSTLLKCSYCFTGHVHMNVITYVVLYESNETHICTYARTHTHTLFGQWLYIYVSCEMLFCSVVNSGYIRYCRLPVRLNLSFSPEAILPWTLPHQQGVSTPRVASHWTFFVWTNSRDCCRF